MNRTLVSLTPWEVSERKKMIRSKKPAKDAKPQGWKPIPCARTCAEILAEEGGEEEEDLDGREAWKIDPSPPDTNSDLDLRKCTNGS